MQQPDALRSTALPQAHPGGLPHAVPPRPPARRTRVIAIVAATFLVGLVIGVAIGRGTTEPAPSAPRDDAGRLAVASLPADGNVVVDGRFVGVAPLDGLDLDPGKHSIVIDAFGYQPYAGTLTIEPRGKLNLKVLLVPIGTDGTSRGDITGTGKATRTAVPASALLPATATPPPTPKRDASSRPARRVESTPLPPPRDDPPPRPRRDCSGEKSRCRDSCSRAEGDCRFNCPHCVTCPSSVGSDECRRQCESCRTSCDRNTKFCETSCDGQYSNCEASQ